ncbi:N-acetylneuraminate synthase family protein [Thermodesulfobacteriota bacterium]
MKIKNFEIGSRALIIAEIGNNHLGDPDLAHKTLEAAAESGVDAIKFQLFNPNLLVSNDAPVLRHVPDRIHGTQRERFKSMLLPPGAFARLAEHAKELGKVFLTTPFDEKSADILEDLVPAFKIASGDANNTPLLKYIISKGKPVLISTGTCEQEEVDKLVSIIPKDNSVLLHCVGSYPTPDDQASLSMIPFYRERYGIFTGYSDHTAGILAPLAAISMGAVVLEKHFILDKSLPAGDREVSLTPKEMFGLVKEIRRVESMLGRTPRKVLPCEKYGRTNLRRGAYAGRDIKTDEKVTIRDIIWLRPEVEKGLSFDDINKFHSLSAKEEILFEQPLTLDNVTLVK